MEKVIIKVRNVIGDSYGIEAKDGKEIFSLIVKAFKEKNKVVLSFEGMEILMTAFLNVAVGQLYRDYSEAFIKKNLSVDNISDSGIASLKRVVSTAKLYYKDPEALRRSINEFLES